MALIFGFSVAWRPELALRYAMRSSARPTLSKAGIINPSTSINDTPSPHRQICEVHTCICFSIAFSLPSYALQISPSLVPFISNSFFFSGASQHLPVTESAPFRPPFHIDTDLYQRLHTREKSCSFIILHTFVAFGLRVARDSF